MMQIKLEIDGIQIGLVNIVNSGRTAKKAHKTIYEYEGYYYKPQVHGLNESGVLETYSRKRDIAKKEITHHTVDGAAVLASKVLTEIVKMK